MCFDLQVCNLGVRPLFPFAPLADDLAANDDPETSGENFHCSRQRVRRKSLEIAPRLQPVHLSVLPHPVFQSAEAVEGQDVTALAAGVRGVQGPTAEETDGQRDIFFPTEKRFCDDFPI